MNTRKIIQTLKEKYPNKTIIENKNSIGETTEIICEIQPSSENINESIAVAVFSQIDKHYHKITTEKYKVIEGQMNLLIDGKKYELNTGDDITINPGEIHSAVSKECTIKVTSNPGSTLEDHILIE